MNKAIALLLICALCITLAACGGSEPAAAPVTEPAVQAQLPETQPETEPEPDPYEAFYCNWVNLRGDSAMTLDSQGNVTYDGAQGSYAIEGEVLSISLEDAQIQLDITDHNGIPRLICGWQYMDFVPETAAGDFEPYTVELTMDNWNTYFDLHETAAFGYINLVMPETGVPDFELRMKPEYVYKLLDAPNGDDSMSKLNPIFTFSYDALGYTYKKGDNGEFVFEFLEALDSAQQNMIPQPRECPLLDYRPYNMTLNEEQCPLFVNGGWYAGNGWTDNDGNPDKGTVIYPINPAVASVSGTLTLLP